MNRQKETIILSFYRSMGIPFLISLIIIIGVASWGFMSLGFRRSQRMGFHGC